MLRLLAAAGMVVMEDPDDPPRGASAQAPPLPKDEEGGRPEAGRRCARSLFGIGQFAALGDARH